MTVREGDDATDDNFTPNFISGRCRIAPLFNDLLNMEGMELPEYLGKKQETAKNEEPKKK